MGVRGSSRDTAEAVARAHNEPGIVDSNTARTSNSDRATIGRYNVETEEAIETEVKIDKELRQWR